MTSGTLIDGTSAAPRFSTAGRFLEGLAAKDFAHLASTLDEHVALRALLPSGPFECAGPTAVQSAFDRWFGHTHEFELVDASIGEVCDRLHLRWRVRVRTDDGWYVVEQQAYADTGPGTLIASLDVLCTGYRPEAADD